MYQGHGKLTYLLHNRTKTLVMWIRTLRVDFAKYVNIYIRTPPFTATVTFVHYTYLLHNLQSLSGCYNVGAVDRSAIGAQISDRTRRVHDVTEVMRSDSLLNHILGQLSTGSPQPAACCLLLSPRRRSKHKMGQYWCLCGIHIP